MTVAPAVSGTERVGCGAAATLCRWHSLSAGGEDTSRGRRGSVRDGPSEQRQWTLQKSRHYLMIVAETIRGKMDTAEMGVGGDFNSQGSRGVLKSLNFDNLNFRP